MRVWALVALVGLVGCEGVAPSDATSAPLATGGGSGALCAVIAPDSLAVTTSAVNPWGSHIGVVTVYTTTIAGSYIAYGTDYPYTQVYWYMNGASTTDIARFEAYPQSMRWCQGSQGSVGGGASPKGQPDPGLYGGICVPTTIAADADNAYGYGPYGTGTNSFCYYDHGEGGCVPRSCGRMCGNQSDGCGGTIYCGICHSCQCGGTYPSCNVCSL
jgi:hypothetical protein